VVETTGITGNYRNDLLTLETGYLELRRCYPFAVPCGAARRNIVMNAAITGGSPRGRRHVSRTITEIKRKKQKRKIQTQVGAKIKCA